MIVPWAPGGSTDQTARVLARAAEKQLGQPIVILNKPGASTIIGMREIAQAKPDGYTIGTLSSSSYLAPLTGQAASYDILKDFTFISYYGDNLIGIAVLKDKPWKTLQDLVEDGKKNPEKINYGTGGVNTTQHLMVEALSRRTGAKFTMCRSAAPRARCRPCSVTMSISSPRCPSGLRTWSRDRLGCWSSIRRSGPPPIQTCRPMPSSASNICGRCRRSSGRPESPRTSARSWRRRFRKALDDPGFRETMTKLQMEIFDLSGPQVREVVVSEIEKAKRLIGFVGAK